MVCSICKQAGHDRRKCTQRATIAVNDTVIVPVKRLVKRPKKASHASAATSDTVKNNADVLSVAYWSQTKTFKTLKDKETQIKYYTRMNSIDEVLQLVSLESKPFGSIAEKIIQEIFHLGPRTSSHNDGTRHGVKIEIKSARYWAGKDNCRWQHLEPQHDYDYILFVLLGFQGWNVWGISKAQLMGELLQKKIITYQGKQGCWAQKSDILPYLTPIRTIQELDDAISTLIPSPPLIVIEDADE